MEATIPVLQALGAALFPKSEAPPGGGQLLQRYHATDGSSPEVAQTVLKLMNRLNRKDRKQLTLLLRLLNSKFGCVLLLGTKSFSGSWLPSTFPGLPVQCREAILQSWATSNSKALRKAFKGLKSMILSVLFSTALVPDGSSPLLHALHYPPTIGPFDPTPAALQAEERIKQRLIDLQALVRSDGSTADSIAAAFRNKGLTCAIDARSNQSRIVATIECDAVIVGSGAGGGVVAARLAAAGLKVVVLEKAGFVSASEMNLRESDAFEQLYEASGTCVSADGGTTVLAGSTLGGGTRVNWCASFKTPDHVRKEWSEHYGLTAITSPEYDTALEAVSARLGIHTGIPHSQMCGALLQGLEKLGVKHGEVPRNCVGSESCDGHCCFGCQKGQKQDSVNTWLADACNFNTTIVTGAWVEKILTETSKESIRGRKKKAVGVLVHSVREDYSHPAAALQLVVSAPVVVCCAGSLHTPALLLRSGLKQQGQVGANLRLHPCTCIVGVFKGLNNPQKKVSGDIEDCGSIRGWEGPNMTVFSNQLGDWEGSGYGCLLYTPAVHPGLFAAAAPWWSGHKFKELMLEYPNAVAGLVLTRDRNKSGRVTVDSTGAPCIHYTLDADDRAAMVQGVKMGLKALAAAGASQVIALLGSAEGSVYEVNENKSGNNDGSVTGDGAGDETAAADFWESDPGFNTYLSEVEKKAMRPLSMPYFSAHQMGTARMGTDPKSSVIDPNGESWECAGVFGADGSSFPTPTGVNPMVTIEALAWLVSGRIVKEVLGPRGKEVNGS